MNTRKYRLLGGWSCIFWPLVVRPLLSGGWQPAQRRHQQQATQGGERQTIVRANPATA